MAPTVRTLLCIPESWEDETSRFTQGFVVIGLNAQSPGRIQKVESPPLLHSTTHGLEYGAHWGSYFLDLRP